MKIQRCWLSSIPMAAFFIAVVLSADAAGPAPGRAENQTISLGIVAEANQKEIERYYRDFVAYVARKLSAEAKVIIASTPSDLAKLLQQQKVDFYMESVYSTYIINDVEDAGKLLLRRWQRGKPEYQSLIFTNRNSGVNRLDDLRGKIIVFENPKSTSGYFLPKFFLQRNGFKLSEKSGSDANVAPAEIGYIFALSQEKLVNLVLTNQAAGGAFSDDDYARVDDKAKAEIGVLAQTERLPRYLVSIRKDLAPALADRLKAILVSMSEDEEGRRILEKTGETTKFDMLPEGEEGMRRRLLETFYSFPRK